MGTCKLDRMTSLSPSLPLSFTFSLFLSFFQSATPTLLNSEQVAIQEENGVFQLNSVPWWSSDRVRSFYILWQAVLRYSLTVPGTRKWTVGVCSNFPCFMTHAFQPQTHGEVQLQIVLISVVSLVKLWNSLVLFFNKNGWMMSSLASLIPSDLLSDTTRWRCQWWRCLSANDSQQVASTTGQHITRTTTQKETQQHFGKLFLQICVAVVSSGSFLSKALFHHGYILGSFANFNNRSA